MDQTTEAIQRLIAVLVVVAGIFFVLAFNDTPRNDN